jgi:ketosteroid isomerase-like protein
MNRIDRRHFLRTAGISAAGLTLGGTSSLRVAVAGPSPTCTMPGQDQQAQREEVEAFFRSYYDARDMLDIDRFMTHWADNAISEDVVFSANGPCATPQPKAAIRAGNMRLFGALKTPGRLAKFIHAVGDMKYGVVAEFMLVGGSFFKNPIDLMNVFNLEGGLISYKPDYWDSGQLPSEELFKGGPATKEGVANPSAPVHADGVLRQGKCTDNYAWDTRHASPEMLAFVTKFHAALSSGNVGRVTRFFTEDAIYINPVLHLHQGESGYAPYNRSIQVRGQKAISRLFEAVLPLLPDTKDSSLIHVVGGSTGGGYEWKSGGIYGKQGLTQSGIRGAAAIDLFADRITRLSVKFDTIQMTQDQRDAIRQALGPACFSS